MNDCASQRGYVAGDDWTSTCHRFQYNIGQAVAITGLIDNRGRNQSMGATVNLWQVLMSLWPAQSYLRFQTVGPDQFCQTFVFRPLSDDVHLKWHTESRPGGYQHMESLFFNQSSYG